MSESHQVIRSRRVVVDDQVRPAAIAIREGVIAAIGDYDDLQSSGQPLDFADAVIMPGLVDSHVHINEPGRADWEGFATATKAAAAGSKTSEPASQIWLALWLMLLIASLPAASKRRY